MLVGDLIVGVRELGPDPCQVIPAPTLLTAGATTAGGGIFNPTSTYYIALTGLTQFGETAPSNEIAVTIGGGQNALALTYSANSLFTALGTGILSIRVYVGSASGVYTTFATLSANTTSATVTATTANGNAPTISRAYLPDTDGGFVSAYTMYRWLNDTLKVAARATNGIQDAVGIASISGQRRYVVTLNGQWLRLDQCFYDGWELDLGNKAETFRNRNLTANISISLMVDAQSDTTRVELYWTPGRTSGTALINGTVTAAATSIPIQNVSGWLLADGYALLSDGTNNEVISYSAQTATALTGCIRGWAGTQPYAFTSAETTITELNIELNGYRMPYVYSVGQSQVSLGVPPGWEPFLKDYMLGLFRSAEQEAQEGAAMMKKATDALEAWVKSNKPVAGPRQCRMYGDYGISGLVPGGLTGGLIIL